MTTLSTREEYEALSKEINLPTGCFINGKSQHPKGAETFTTLNPASGEVLAEICSTDSETVDIAVGHARTAFDDGRWSAMQPSQRKSVLVMLAKLIKRNAKQLAVLESLESGKPIAEIEQVDIPEAIDCLLWHAESIDKIYDQIAPASDDVLAMIVREPIGVVACILPWNFPILMMAWKIAPALAAGNSVLVKPAEETSMTALLIAELAAQAGVPNGVLSVLPGLGEVTGRALGLHPDIDMISFTGSTEIGKCFLEYSAQSNMKQIVLECGGKNPCVVLEDAENLDVVAQHVCNAAWWNMGQNCSASSRLIVHEDIEEQLLAAIKLRCKEWTLGHPLDPNTQLGPLISERHYQRVTKYIETAVSEGASLFMGGQNQEMGSGWYVEPTIFTGVSSDMTIAREEVFGPVLSVITVKSLEQAILVANDSDFGLAASIFTSNLRSAHIAAKSIRAGTVTVNTYGEGNMATPFGGYKQSGFGGRDNSLHAHDQFTETKTIWIDLSDQTADALS